MSKAHISEFWTYFTICDAENVNCKLCDKKYSRKGRTTSAMRNHLEAKYKNEYEELKKREHEKQYAAKINSLASSSRQSNPTCFKEGLKSQESIIAAINKCKKIATHFHHSNVAQDELVNLQEKLNQPKLKIIQECVTRCNSTFYMLERILKNKDSLCLYASTSNKISQLTSEEWILVEKLITLLQPFEEITRELSAANVSISSVILLLATLEKVIDEYNAFC
ncbi:unnamed protein product [Parnassius apollo]|uniref:(apollo) hypothetical protein n=1 Tax=Parnassius apollo TaxID=110799 RepID=A0A8S3XB46_PARAO|nr:unnamed protein product [Parnassius apollo]